MTRSTPKNVFEAVEEFVQEIRNGKRYIVGLVDVKAAAKITPSAIDRIRY